MLLQAMAEHVYLSIQCEGSNELYTGEMTVTCATGLDEVVTSLPRFACDRQLQLTVTMHCYTPGPYLQLGITVVVRSLVQLQPDSVTDSSLGFF